MLIMLINDYLHHNRARRRESRSVWSELERCELLFLRVFFLFLFQVWTSIPNEGGPVYFLGPAAAEHPQQALLPDDQWSSGAGTGQLLMTM